MKGSLSHETEMEVPAAKAWEVYGSLQLAKLASELTPDVISKALLEQGDGGVGTVLHVFFGPAVPGANSYKEKFVRVDHEKRLKEAATIEGGFLDLGFKSYSVIFEISEKSEESCVLKSTVEYEVYEEHASNASFVTIGPVTAIAEAISKYLVEKKAIEA